MNKILIGLLVLSLSGSGETLDAARARINQAKNDVRAGKHFEALKKLFWVQQNSAPYSAEAVHNIMRILVSNQMWNLSTYFYLKALNSGKDDMIEAVTPFTGSLVSNVGLEMLQGLMLKNTKMTHYKGASRDYFLYIAGKYLFSQGNYSRVTSYLELIDKSSPLYPFSRYVLGSAKIILGQINAGITDFIECRETAVGSGNQFANGGELKDLNNRCRIGIARAYYQVEDYEKSFQFYDEIDQTSTIWTEALFEAAWAAYSVGDYNRALGKLVTYKAPILAWVYNPEIELLRAQSYLRLCLYDYVAEGIQEFKAAHIKSGKAIREYLQTRSNKYQVLYREAVETLGKPRDEANDVEKVMNNTIREPYFIGVVNSQKYIEQEIQILNRLAGGDIDSGVGRILRNIIEWRRRKNEEIGGRFVQRNLYTNYKRLLSFLDQITFIKLDMLSNQRQKIMKEKPMDEYHERSRGSLGPPNRKDHQYIWVFNGEFWMDELGDYVFALKTECEDTKTGKN